MTTTNGRVALVFCVHHKPWLIMSTLMTMLVQDLADTDVFFIYNIGDGECRDRPSYRPYLELAARVGADKQLSAFDPRVREACRLRGMKIQEIEFENDGALDSGAWYKFIRTGLWRDYEHVCFLGEGTLFTRPNALRAIVDFARERDIHFMASGHEKRRIPKTAMLRGPAWRAGATPMKAFRDEMIGETFAVFCRDPKFKAVFDAWADDGVSRTENHVPEIWPRSRAGSRLWNAINARTASRLTGFREPLLRIDGLAASAHVTLADWSSAQRGPRVRPDGDSYVHVDGVRQKVSEVAATTERGGVRFHQVPEPEWYGCATNHLMSNAFLERFVAKLDEHEMHSVVDIPFAGAALEIVWGFLPAWLGVDKWFTDGLHRVRKHFVTYRRQDDTATMAAHVNRYQRGRVAVGWAGDLIKVRRLGKDLVWMKDVLPAMYF